VVSYRLSIVTVALSVTIWPQFAIECLRRSNQHGVGHFGPKFPDVTCHNISNTSGSSIFSVRQYAEHAICYRPSVCPSVCLSINQIWL